MSLHKVSQNDEPAFSYSVRMDMLSVEEQMRRWDDGGDDAAEGVGARTTGTGERGGFKPLTSVQLRDRVWIITDCDGKKEEVRGEAVIGEYPLLKAAAKQDESPPPFTYQSCTGCKTPGTMEGGFTFVEGSIAHPTGPDFFVRCPLFRLEQPEYMF